MEEEGDRKRKRSQSPALPFQTQATPSTGSAPLPLPWTPTPKYQSSGNLPPNQHYNTNSMLQHPSQNSVRPTYPYAGYSMQTPYSSHYPYQQQSPYASTIGAYNPPNAPTTYASNLNSNFSYPPGSMYTLPQYAHTNNTTTSQYTPPMPARNGISNPTYASRIDFSSSQRPAENNSYYPTKPRDPAQPMSYTAAFLQQNGSNAQHGRSQPLSATHRLTYHQIKDQHEAQRKDAVVADSSTPPTTLFESENPAYLALPPPNVKELPCDVTYQEFTTNPIDKFVIPQYPKLCFVCHKKTSEIAMMCATCDVYIHRSCVQGAEICPHPSSVCCYCNPRQPREAGRPMRCFVCKASFCKKHVIAQADAVMAEKWNTQANLGEYWKCMYCHSLPGTAKNIIGWRDEPRVEFLTIFSEHELSVEAIYIPMAVLQGLVPALLDQFKRLKPPMQTASESMQIRQWQVQKMLAIEGDQAVLEFRKDRQILRIPTKIAKALVGGKIWWDKAKQLFDNENKSWNKLLTWHQDKKQQGPSTLPTVAGRVKVPQEMIATLPFYKTACLEKSMDTVEALLTFNQRHDDLILRDKTYQSSWLQLIIFIKALDKMCGHEQGPILLVVNCQYNVTQEWDFIVNTLTGAKIRFTDLPTTPEQMAHDLEIEEYVNNIKLMFDYKITHPHLVKAASEIVVIQQVVLCSATAFMKCKEKLATVRWHSLVTNLSALEQLALASPDKSFEHVKALSETPAAHRVLLTEVLKDMISPFQDSILKVFFEKSTVVGEFERPAGSTPTNLTPTGRAEVHRPVAGVGSTVFRPGNNTRAPNYPPNYNPASNPQTPVSASASLDSPRIQPSHPVTLTEGGTNRIRKDEVYLCHWNNCYHSAKSIADLQQHLSTSHLNNEANKLAPVKRETADKLRAQTTNFDPNTTDVILLQQQAQLLQTVLIQKETENALLSGRLKTLMDGTWQAVQAYSNRAAEADSEDKRKSKGGRKVQSNLVAMAGAKAVELWVKAVNELGKIDSTTVKTDEGAKAGRKKLKSDPGTYTLGIIVRDPLIGKKHDAPEMEQHGMKSESTYSRRKGLRSRPGDNSSAMLASLRSSAIKDGQ